MKLWLTLDDRETEVEFTEAEGKLFLEIDGRRIEADFQSLPDGEVYSLLVDGRSYEVSVASAESLQVSLRGQVFPVEVRHPLEKALGQVRRHGRGPGAQS